MWRKIKSNFILKKIFNYLDHTKKLRIIIYNKILQKKFGLNLIEYIRWSGKYKEEENGQIKIYNSYNNDILFEGNYSNGEKNIFGKEYDEKGRLIFEGEYLNGKKWKGVAKEYSEYNGKLILEYSYLDGKIDGEAKEFDEFNGQLLFEGKYLNGKRNGKGIEYRATTSGNYESSYSSYFTRKLELFSGEYLNGERKKGKEYNYNGNLVYEGEYLNGKRNGKGKFYDEDENLRHDGEFLNGKKHGKGIEYNRIDEIKYIGEFINGKKNGKGIEYKLNNNYYTQKESIYYLKENIIMIIE